DIVRLPSQLRRQRSFGFFVPVELHQRAGASEHQIAMLQAEPCGGVCLNQRLFGSLLRAECSRESITSSAVARRQGHCALECFARFGNTLHGEASSAERRPCFAVLLVRCNELARMSVGSFVARRLITDARECETRGTKSRIEHQRTLQFRDALLESTARRQQQ